MLHQGANARPLQLVAADQHAVGARVGHQQHLCFTTALLGFGLGQGVQHADHILGYREAQLDDIGLLHRRFVHAIDDAAYAVDVAGQIGNDNGVAGGVGRHMGLLWHQGAQYRNQLGGGDIFQADDFGHVFVGGVSAGIAIAYPHRGGAGILALYDPDHAIGAHGGVAVHLQNGQEQLVQLLAGDRLAGNHLDLALHGGVHHDGGARGFRHELDQLLDIGFFQVDGELLGRGLHRAEQQGQQDGERTAAGNTIQYIHLAISLWRRDQSRRRVRSPVRQMLRSVTGLTEAHADGHGRAIALQLKNRLAGRAHRLV